MRKKIFVIFLCLFSFTGIWSLSLQEQEGIVKQYKIGPKDLLEIKVFEFPELNQIVRVSEDGSITIPLVGRVVIGGLTKDEVEQKLANLLEVKYIKNARVSVFIQEYQSKQVAIIGAVGMPGMYELIGRITLLQVLSQAGGITEKASNRILVLREGKNGISAKISIDLDDLMINGNQKLNIPLQPNDVITIPVDKIIHVFVFGAVTKPGALEVSTSKGITLLQAIAQAGGPAEGASKSGIIIARRDPKSNKEIKIKVNLKDIIKGKKPDIVLQEGDVVYVPESIF